MDKKSSSRNVTTTMEDPEKCRSLVCDASGIIIAEMVYRCMICHYVTDSIQEARSHYQGLHMHEDDEEEDHHARQEQVPSTESMLYKDKARMSRSLQQQHQRKSVLNQALNHSNPLVPDISLYEDESPKSYKTENSALNLSSSGGQSVPATNGSSTKSGYVTCAVCNVTRYYSCVQRRYGQFTCVTCYRYFRTFLLKPKRYACPSLGECALNVRTRCRACWIKACISVFSVDARRQQVIQANLPVKKAGSIKIPPSIPQEQHMAIDYQTTENGDRDDADSPSSLPLKVEMGDEGMDMLEPEVSLTEDADDQADEDSHPEQDQEEPSSAISDSEEGLQDGEINSSLMQQSMDSSLNKLIVTGKKVWSCGKCMTCTAEDCGTCIYCLDRPKFGGPFIKKQRCVKRRCLMKIKSKQTLLLKKQ